MCRAGGVASVAALVASGPHLAVTASAVAALRFLVDGCSECAAAAASAGAVTATVDLLGQTADPELLEAALTVRWIRMATSRRTFGKKQTRPKHVAQRGSATYQSL